MRSIELLCPAKNAETAFEAIRCGADAIYIGGPSFGARAAAGNSVEDIRSICDFAHLYGARVYVTLNTILYDDELSEAEMMVGQLYEAGVDALITQDLALLKMNLPPDCASRLHTDGHVHARKSPILGARRLFTDRRCARTFPASVARHQFCRVRSHRGLCARRIVRELQRTLLCFAALFRPIGKPRLLRPVLSVEFRLGRRQRQSASTGHQLSMRDMNRTESIEDMLDAGVSSFKIEGRLKDINYVRNVTAHYRQQIDAIIERRPEEFRRSSFGTSKIGFTPQVEKSFNRGFTDYFLRGRRPDVVSMRTPKAIGAPVGSVHRVGKRSFTVDGTVEFANGDGLCYFDAQGTLQGFRVNRVEAANSFRCACPIRCAPAPNCFAMRIVCLKKPSTAPQVSACCTLK